MTLVWSFSRGYRRGLLLTLIDLVSVSIVTIMANLASKPVGELLKSVIPSPGLMEKSETGNAAVSTIFFNGLAFFLVMIVFWIIVRALRKTSRIFTKLPVIHFINAILGSLIGLIISYFLIFLVLHLIILLSNDWLQNQYKTSQIAQWIVKQSPVLAKSIYGWWVIN